MEAETSEITEITELIIPETIIVDTMDIFRNYRKTQVYNEEGCLLSSNRYASLTLSLTSVHSLLCSLHLVCGTI